MWPLFIDVALALVSLVILVIIAKRFGQLARASNTLFVCIAAMIFVLNLSKLILDLSTYFGAQQ